MWKVLFKFFQNPMGSNVKMYALCFTRDRHYFPQMGLKIKVPYFFFGVTLKRQKEQRGGHVYRPCKVQQVQKCNYCIFVSLAVAYSLPVWEYWWTELPKVSKGSFKHDVISGRKWKLVFPSKRQLWFVSNCVVTTLFSKLWIFVPKAPYFNLFLDLQVEFSRQNIYCKFGMLV